MDRPDFVHIVQLDSNSLFVCTSLHTSKLTPMFPDSLRIVDYGRYCCMLTALLSSSFGHFRQVHSTLFVC